MKYRALDHTLDIRLRIILDGNVPFGPGKAELLEHIQETGSITAAGRRMGMSYKRAWNLVDEMNGAFTHKLVQSTRGGLTGGGARLTPKGKLILSTYRRMEKLIEVHSRGELNTLCDNLKVSGNDTP